MESVVQGWFGRLPQILWNGRQCPLCSSIRFEEAESGPLDGLLGIFMLRPIRCVNCWRRYYWFARTSSIAR
jgi:hypothetical protein